jgi:hypothetical protein
MEFSRDAGMMMENKRNVCSLGESSIKRHKSDLSFSSKVLLILASFHGFLGRNSLRYNKLHGNDPSIFVLLMANRRGRTRLENVFQLFNK